MNKNYIRKVLYLWVDGHKDDCICGTISDLPPTIDDCNKWLSDDYRIAFDFALSRIEFINLFGLSQLDVDRLLNDEVYIVSFDNLGSVFETPTAVSKEVYTDNILINSTTVSKEVYTNNVLINEDPSIKIYYDKDEHKNHIDDEYNLKSCI